MKLSLFILSVLIIAVVMSGCRGAFIDQQPLTEEVPQIENVEQASEATDDVAQGLDDINSQIEDLDQMVG